MILEEIAMYDDQPFWRLYERAGEIYYGEHPLGHRVLGTKESIRDLACDRMRSYFNLRYKLPTTPSWRWPAIWTSRPWSIGSSRHEDIGNALIPLATITS